MAKRDRLSIEEGRREQFDKLKERLGKGAENKDAFFVAMAYGFAQQERRPLEKKWGVILNKSLSPEDWCLIVAVGLADQHEILDDFDIDDALETAEEYARGGIGLLNDRLKDSVEFREGLIVDVVTRLPELISAEELDS
jgi:hypothetical protein